MASRTIANDDRARYSPKKLSSDFDLAEKHFDELGIQDPFRLDELDTYSNILYVMGKSGKLAQLAQKYAALDPNRPEVCCLIGL